MSVGESGRQSNQLGFAQLAAIVESSGDGIVCTTLDGVIESWNPGAERIYGYAAREMLGRSIQLLVPPDRTGELQEMIERLKRDERVEHHETRRVRKDGRRIYVSVSIAPIRDAAGTITGAATIARDITERKRAERERADLLLREQEARAEAEAAVRVRDHVLTSVTHDLKGPLTSIRLRAQLLKRREARSGAAEGAPLAAELSEIEAATLKMAAMIDELLDVARLHMGEPLELRRTPTDLVVLARQAVSAHQRLSDRHRIDLEAAVPELTGEWDAMRLERVLDNLLSNAVKYSPEGGRIAVSTRRSAFGTGVWAELEVRDPGVGIPAADLPHVFERFHRGANVTGRIAGTGIGLAGVRQIVEQHGGTVHVQSREGHGAAFTVRLPLGL